LDARSDEEVMMRVRDGDVDELGILFERHHGRLFAFCLRMTGDRDTAGDLVQEVFVRMLRYRTTYREQGAFLAWMYRLARNVCVDHFRHQGGAVREVAEDEAAVDLPSQEALPAERASRREEVRLLERALRKLSAEKRETLLLARFGSMPYAQIAEALGCTVSTVKVRVHRAVRELREIYTTLAGEVPS
jgi:RNA polymerase sigma-70 factor (ECF subfamily)